MSELVIEIGGAGKVAALHMDGFDLGFLGDKHVRRQTDILFNGDTQQWDIHYIEEGALHTGPELKGFSSYENARSFEVTWVNQCRLAGVGPLTEEGRAYANKLRG